MDFAEYERSGRALYAGFVQAVASILKSALIVTPDLHLQEIQFRAKDNCSLYKKLERRALQESCHIEAEIKDLAGCRVIFYTNSDVDAFAASGLLNNNFKIDGSRTKIHYPTSDTADANALFISDNYVVMLDEKRSKLPEYVRFAGLLCEIQVQTILNHAWAEMAHDTIYKRPITRSFGSQLFDSINLRLSKVMRDHLLPAGYEFQKIRSDYRRLLAGKDMFESGALEAIRACDNLNDLHDTIERFALHVLPHYDDIEAVFPAVSDALVDAIERARVMPEVAYTTGWGKYPGRSPETIFCDVCDILSLHRYVDIDRSLATVLRLAPAIRGEAQQKALDRFAIQLFEYNVSVWKEVGGAAQAHLVDHIQKLDDREAAAALPTLTTMLTQVLKTTVTGTTHKAEAVVLHRHPVIGSEELIAGRHGAIAQLKRLYGLARTNESRAVILHGLDTAGDMPHSGCTNALHKIIVDNLTSVVRFYREIAPGMPLEERREIEGRLFRHFYSCPQLPPNRADGCDLSIASTKLVEEIRIAGDTLNRDPDFVIYKTLVGFDSVSERMWATCCYDYESDEAEKSKEIELLVRSVDAGTIEEWVDRLNRYAETTSDDLAMFRNLGEFLRRVAEKKPDLFETFLGRMNGLFERFLPALLHGLANGGNKDLIDIYIDRWIEAGDHLEAASWYLYRATLFNPNQVLRLLTRAMAADKLDAILNCILAATHQYGDHPEDLIEAVFLPGIEFLTGRNDLRWLGSVFFTWRTTEILSGLNEAQAGRVLDAVLLAPSLERRGEELLAGIAESWPDLVIDFLGRRLALAAGGDAPPEFDAIPYNLSSLNKPLARSPDRLVKAMRKWFDTDKERFRYRGSRLAAAVFPDFPSILEDRLRVEIQDGSAASIEFVLKLLGAYCEVQKPFPLCRDIVAALDPGSDLLNLVRAILWQTGVVTGPFGSALALEEKHRALSTWLDDPIEAVRTFAKKILQSLEQSIAAERRRADQQVAMRNVGFRE